MGGGGLASLCAQPWPSPTLCAGPQGPPAKPRKALGWQMDARQTRPHTPKPPWHLLLEASCPTLSLDGHHKGTNLPTTHQCLCPLSVNHRPQLQRGLPGGSLKEAHVRKRSSKVRRRGSPPQRSSAAAECKHHRKRQNRELRIWTPCLRSNLQRTHIPNIRGAQQGSALL